MCNIPATMTFLCKAFLEIKNKTLTLVAILTALFELGQLLAVYSRETRLAVPQPANDPDRRMLPLCK